MLVVMRWTGETERGAWLRPRLSGWGRVGSTVPTGFEAYVRIFHPFQASRDGETATWTWAEVAARTGRVLHPLAQADNLLGAVNPVTIDGWEVDSGAEGFLEPAALAALVAPLKAATRTPDDVTIGIWNGWGELNSGSASVFGWGSDGPLSPSEVAALEREFAEQRASALSPEVARAVKPRRSGAPTGLLLALPHRAYVLLSGTIDELADPDWPYRAGIGWSRSTSFPLTGPMPQLVWPADHAWCVASEIDLDSTIVGGSRTLADAILALPALEALEVPPDGDLSSEGDRVNPVPGGPS